MIITSGEGGSYSVMREECSFVLYVSVLVTCLRTFVCVACYRAFIVRSLYRYAPHNDVATNDRPHTRRRSYNIMISITLWYSAFEKSLWTYSRCWKWCSRASIQAWTRLILLANTFCRSAFEKSLCTYERCWKWCPGSSIPGMSNMRPAGLMRPFASTPAACTKNTVIWSFNGQNCSFYNLNWTNVRRSQKNGMLFFI
jgi:hypothetical protein